MRFKFKDRKQVLTTSMFGERIVSPEFVFVVCDDCNNEGFVSQTALDTLDEDEPIKCKMCS